MAVLNVLILIIITTISYWFGILSQEYYQENMPFKERKIDKFYPLTTGKWIIIHMLYGLMAMIMEIFGRDGNYIYSKRFAKYRRAEPVMNMIGLEIACSLALLYYPTVFAIFYYYDCFNAWFATPVALGLMISLNVGYGRILSGYIKDKAEIDRKETQQLFKSIDDYDFDDRLY